MGSVTVSCELNKLSNILITAPHLLDLSTNVAVVDYIGTGAELLAGFNKKYKILS